MARPTLLLTGASGFIGRHLLDALKEDYRIYALARRSQIRCGAPFHENIIWHQVDIGYAKPLRDVFKEIQAGGGVDLVLHLAAHYDFSGIEHQEYQRTNVHGLRNVLDCSRLVNPRRFFFSSSVAACAFPEPGKCLDENSPPDGDHIYARSKAIGEDMLKEYSRYFPTAIVRFAALFSDWCEYPPLYMFIRTWLSRAWNRRMLGGKGQSAIPYLHVTDAVSLLTRALKRHEDLEEREIIIASPDGSVSHEELYRAATTYENDRAKPPIFTPKFLVKPGIHIMGLLGRLQSEEPFEKPWMANYVDLAMDIDASRTRERLGWQPRKRLEILNRMPFLIENLKYDRIEWTRRNRDAMKLVRVRPNLKIHSLLEKHKDEIAETFTRALKRQYPSYQTLSDQDHSWNHRLIMRALRNAIRLRVKADFMDYCRDLAERRFEEGFSGQELLGALETLNEVCLDVLHRDPEAHDMRPHMPACITTTIQFGKDQVMDVIDQQQADVAQYVPPADTTPPDNPPPSPAGDGGPL